MSVVRHPGNIVFVVVVVIVTVTVVVLRSRTKLTCRTRNHQSVSTALSRGACPANIVNRMTPALQTSACRTGVGGDTRVSLPLLFAAGKNRKKLK